MTARKLQGNFLSDIQTQRKGSLSQIRPGGKLSAAAALKVYQRGYISRLTEALGSTYETVWYVLGDRLFFKTCHDFIQRNKSRTYNLNHYGENFAAFLKAKFPRRPYLYHLALFERETARIFNLAAPPGGAADFAKINPQRDRFVFQPAVTLCRYPFRVYTLWKNRSKIPRGYVPPDFTSNEAVLIYRRNNEVFFAVMTPAQFAVTRELLKGKTLEAALASGTRGKSPGEKEIRDLFATLASPGIVRALKS